MLRYELMTYNASNTLSLLRPVLTETSIKYKASVLSAHEISTISDFPGAKPDSEDGLMTLRYLITREGENRFALEGRPSERIAAHEAMPRQMSDDCLFASNISINANNEIVKLNNKSSNYQTPKSHLPYGIMALRLLTLKHPGFKLAESITIESFHRNPTSNVRITEHQLSRDEFIQLADEMIAACKLKPEYYDSEKQFLFDYSEERAQRLKAKYPPAVISDTPQSSRARSEATKKKSLNFNLFARPLNEPVQGPGSTVAISESKTPKDPANTPESSVKPCERNAFHPVFPITLSMLVQSLKIPLMPLTTPPPSPNFPSSNGENSGIIPMSTFHRPYLAPTVEDQDPRVVVKRKDIPSDTESETHSTTSTEASFNTTTIGVLINSPIENAKEDQQRTKVMKLR